MTILIHIVSTGARTPVGIASAPAAAAVRAGISALGEHPFMVDQMGDPMPAALDHFLDPLMFGKERMIALATSTLDEVCLPLTEHAGAGTWSLPVFLGLPETRPGFNRDDAEAVRIGVMRHEGWPVEISSVHMFPEGHAAGLAALAAATHKMRHGEFEACLVGAVDSYFHPVTMEWLDENRQLAGIVSRSGFVPGEGAGFCLMMTESARNRLGLNALVQVLSTAVDWESNLIKTSDVCLGQGLTQAVKKAIQILSPPVKTISNIICDINGERYRSEEWGFTCLRLPHYFDDPAIYTSPAEIWGDMGAASGPLFAMLACQASYYGYARGGRTLLWASSEKGLRAGAVLDADAMLKNARDRSIYG